MARIKKIRRPGSPIGRVQRPNFWLKYGAEAGDPCAGGPSARLVSITNCSCSYTAPATNCTTQCRYEVRSECYTNPPNNFTWANEGGTVIGGGTAADDFIIIEITSSTSTTVELNVHVTDTVSGDTDYVAKVFTHVHTNETLAPFFKGPDINNVSFASDTPISTFDFSQVFGGYITGYTLVGNWPAGLSIDNNGLLTGTPTGVAIYDSLTVEASGPGGTATTNPFTVTIYNATAESLTVSQVQAAVCSYNSGIGQTECVAPGIYTATPVGWTTPPDSWIWSISSTSAGITALIVAGQDTDTVDVDVTGAANGSITLHCEASNTNGELASDLTQFFTAHTDTVEDIVFIGPNIGDLTMTVDVPFTLDISALFTGTITVYTLGGSWPGGFAIDENGVITGTTTSEAFYGNAFVRADNSVDFAISDIFDIYSVPAVPVFNGTIANMVGDEGVPIATYDSSLHYQAGGAVSTYTLKNAPTWMNIGTTSGVISGTPDATSGTGVQVNGANSQGNADSNLFNVTVTPDITVDPPIFTGPVVIPAVQVDTAFSHDMSQYFSGDPVDSYALTNDGGQAWLSINTSTGELSGQTPATPVTVSGVNVTATNAGGSTPTGNFGFEVEAGAGYGTDLVWTYETTTPDEVVGIGTTYWGTYNATIYWGDGTDSHIGNYNSNTHTYASPGVHEIKVVGTYTSLLGGNPPSVNSHAKFRELLNLGHMGYKDLGVAFKQATGGLTFTSGDCDTSVMTTMSNMFASSPNFTAIDVSTMDTALCANMAAAFLGVSISVDASSWSIASMTNGSQMFFQSQLNTTDYDATLIAWAAQATIQPNVTVSFGTAKYSAGAAAAAKAVLAGAPNNWTITDGGPV